MRPVGINLKFFKTSDTYQKTKYYPNTDIGTALNLRKPVISYGDHIKIGLIKTCDHLPIHGIWQNYIYALDMSIGKQDVLGNRNRPKKPLMMGVIFCY
jgi:hypothetical protein